MTRLLMEPVPNMDDLRARKREGYSQIPIRHHKRYSNEPLVRLSDLGIAGQNYYSRPNATVSQPIPGVAELPELRRSVAETLARINGLMRHVAVTAFFGTEVELYVEDGLRTVTTQARLHEEDVPALIRRNDPGLSDSDVDERRKSIIAVPSYDPDRPSPHSTGGAVDVILREKHPETPLYTGEESKIWLGHRDGDTATTINPDYYESHPLHSDEDRRAQRHRRAFYAIMTGRVFGYDTDLVVNPTEIWHWSRGDQLWALGSGATSAYYRAVN